MTDQNKPKPNLRSALAEAQSKVKGLVYKAGTNQAQRYSYVGHEDVIEHVRAVMVACGIIIVPTLLRFVQELSYRTKSGDNTAWLWEQTFEISHAHSEDTQTATVQVTTTTNDKASFIASTAADRTLLMRLMRLAGTSEENPEHDSHDQGQQAGPGGGRPAQARPSGGGQQQRGADPAAVLATALTTLHSELTAQNDFDALARFHNHAVAVFERLGQVPEGPHSEFWAAWGKRCSSLKLNPREVAAAARARRAA